MLNGIRTTLILRMLPCIFEEHVNHHGYLSADKAGDEAAGCRSLLLVTKCESPLGKKDVVFPPWKAVREEENPVALDSGPCPGFRSGLRRFLSKAPRSWALWFLSPKQQSSIAVSREEQLRGFAMRPPFPSPNLHHLKHSREPNLTAGLV